MPVGIGYSLMQSPQYRKRAQNLGPPPGPRPKPPAQDNVSPGPVPEPGATGARATAQPSVRPVPGAMTLDLPPGTTRNLGPPQGSPMPGAQNLGPPPGRNDLKLPPRLQNAVARGELTPEQAQSRYGTFLTNNPNAPGHANNPSFSPVRHFGVPTFPGGPEPAPKPQVAPPVAVKPPYPGPSPMEGGHKGTEPMTPTSPAADVVPPADPTQPHPGLPGGPSGPPTGTHPGIAALFAGSLPDQLPLQALAQDPRLASTHPMLRQQLLADQARRRPMLAGNRGDSRFTT